MKIQLNELTHCATEKIVSSGGAYCVRDMHTQTERTESVKMSIILTSLLFWLRATTNGFGTVPPQWELINELRFVIFARRARDDKQKKIHQSTSQRANISDEKNICDESHIRRSNAIWRRRREQIIFVFLNHNLVDVELFIVWIDWNVFARTHGPSLFLLLNRIKNHQK